MRRWCLALMMFGAAQLLVGLALVPVGWGLILNDHYLAWDRLGIAFRDGAIDAETYPQFASANGVFVRGSADFGPEAPRSGNGSAEQFMLWVNADSQRLRFLAIAFPWLLSGCGVVTLFFGWRIGRAAARAGIAS